MTDYMILGAGAVGCVFGGMLAHAGKQVQLVTRSPDLGAAVAGAGLTLSLQQGDITVHPMACQPDRARPAPVILILTKSFDTEAAIEGIRPQITRDCVLVTLQNGLGNAELLARLCPDNLILQGMTMLPATYLRPGQVRAKGVAEAWLGPLPDQDREQHRDQGREQGRDQNWERAMAVAHQLAADLALAGGQIHVQEDVRPAIWQKACFNIAMNGVGALIDGGPGLIPDTEGLQELVFGLMEETIEVARLQGIEIDSGQVRALITKSTSQHRTHTPSMLQDIRAGRRTEIGALNGAVLEMARQHQVAVPLNQMIDALVRAREAAPLWWQQAGADHPAG